MATLTVIRVPKATYQAGQSPWEIDTKRLPNTALTFNGKSKKPSEFSENIRNSYGPHFIGQIGSILPESYVEAGFIVSNASIQQLAYTTPGSSAASTKKSTSPRQPQINLDMTVAFSLKHIETQKIITIPGTMTLRFEQLNLSDRANYNFELKSVTPNSDAMKILQNATPESDEFKQLCYQSAKKALEQAVKIKPTGKDAKLKSTLQQAAKTLLTAVENAHTEKNMDTETCTEVLEQATSLLKNPSDKKTQTAFATTLNKVAKIDNRFKGPVLGGMLMMVGSAVILGGAFVVGGPAGIGFAKLALIALKSLFIKHAVVGAFASLTVASGPLSMYGLFPAASVRETDNKLNEMQKNVTTPAVWQ